MERHFPLFSPLITALYPGHYIKQTEEGSEWQREDRQAKVCGPNECLMSRSLGLLSASSAPTLGAEEVSK